MKTKFFYWGFIVVTFCISCQKDIISDKNDIESPVIQRDNKFDLKKQFSLGLAKVLKESKNVRDLIKQHALKKINYDYDVLYALVKNEKLNDGHTLRELLLKYISEENLLLIETKIPNLTIFVPELPLKSFSADSWDIVNQIPAVGIRTTNTNDVPFFDSEGVESIIESYKIPNFPIVVIKENERIVVSNSTTRVLNTRTFSSKNSETEFAFISNVFDNINNENESDEFILTRNTKATISGTTIPVDKLFKAYDIYKDINGWHRDYIYYNLTPEQTKGPFHYNIKEHLLSFEMVGDARGAMNKIADQTDDPRVDGKWHRHEEDRGNGTKIIWHTPWTDGEFEFQIKVYLANTNSFGSEFITYLRIDPNELFDITPVSKDYDKSFVIKSIANKRVNTKLPLFEWDLESYGSTVKIAIEEVDSEQSIVQSLTTESEFATNFGFDATWGEKTKIGLKFGASNKDTKKTTYQITTTEGNEKLGDVLVNFGDDVILSKELTPTSSRRGAPKRPDYNDKYYTSWYKISIAPVVLN